MSKKATTQSSLFRHKEDKPKVRPASMEDERDEIVVEWTQKLGGVHFTGTVTSSFTSPWGSIVSAITSSIIQAGQAAEMMWQSENRTGLLFSKLNAVVSHVSAYNQNRTV